MILEMVCLRGENPKVIKVIVVIVAILVMHDILRQELEVLRNYGTCEAHTILRPDIARIVPRSIIVIRAAVGS